MWSGRAFVCWYPGVTTFEVQINGSNRSSTVVVGVEEFKLKFSVRFFFIRKMLCIGGLFGIFVLHLCTTLFVGGSCSRLKASGIFFFTEKWNYNLPLAAYI